MWPPAFFRAVQANALFCGDSGLGNRVRAERPARSRLCAPGSWGHGKCCGPETLCCCGWRAQRVKSSLRLPWGQIGAKPQRPNESKFTPAANLLSKLSPMCSETPELRWPMLAPQECRRPCRTGQVDADLSSLPTSKACQKGLSTFSGMGPGAPSEVPPYPLYQRMDHLWRNLLLAWHCLLHPVPVLRLGSRGPGGDHKSSPLCPQAFAKRSASVREMRDVVVAQRRTVLAFGLAPGPRVSKVPTVTKIGGYRGDPGRETQSCHFWTWSSRLKSVNSHRDRGGHGHKTQNCRCFWTRL